MGAMSPRGRWRVTNEHNLCPCFARRAARLEYSVAHEGEEERKAREQTAFVKNLPQTMPAKDVVAKAKAAGITLTEMSVYSIRSKSKAHKGSGATRGPGRPASALASAGAARSGGDLVSEESSTSWSAR